MRRLSLLGSSFVTRAALSARLEPAPEIFAQHYAPAFAARARAAFETALMDGGDAHARLPEVIQVIAADEARRAYVIATDPADPADAAVAALEAQIARLREMGEGVG